MWLIESGNEASDVHVQAARVSADAVAAAVTLTNDCIKDGNAVEATSKAAASAWRSSQVSCLFKLNSQQPSPALGSALLWVTQASLVSSADLLVAPVLQATA